VRTQSVCARRDLAEKRELGDPRDPGRQQEVELGEHERREEERWWRASKRFGCLAVRRLACEALPVVADRAIRHGWRAPRCPKGYFGFSMRDNA